MRFRLLLFVLTAVAQAPTGAAQDSGGQTDVAVRVSAIRNSKGNIRCVLWRSPAGFPRDIAQGFQRQEADITDGSALVTFKSVPRGAYAVSCIHDENLNRSFDSNFLGVPKEGYGFSNNAKGRLGPPRFEAAQVQVGLSVDAILIRLNY